MIVVRKGFARGQKSCADDDVLRAPAQGSRKPSPVHNPACCQDRHIDMRHYAWYQIGKMGRPAHMTGRLEALSNDDVRPRTGGFFCLPN